LAVFVEKVRINGFLIFKQVTDTQMNKTFSENYSKRNIKFFDFKFFKREDHRSRKKFSLGGDMMQPGRAFFGLVTFFIAGMFSDGAAVHQKK
jgi:hypothetical protein